MRWLLAAFLLVGCLGPNEDDSVSETESAVSARTVRLVDGSVVRGVPIAAYDHATWWWDASPEVTYALFDSSGWSATPGEDRSLRFIDQSRIAPGQRAILAPAEPPAAYRAWARNSGIVLQRLPLDGVAQVLNGNERWHRDEGGFGDFAWDLVRAFPDGATSHAPGTAVTDYAVWDAPVYLPTGGWVVDVDDSQPDNAPGSIPPGPMKSIVNNMIGVQVSGSYYVYLLHFRQGSIPRSIERGQWLPAGTYVGRVGNSGVTYEPHLHVTAYFWDAERSPARSWSAPVEFANLYVRSATDAAATFRPWSVPAHDDAISNAPF